MSDATAGPRIAVNVFPHEGGAYAIQGGQVLRCQTHKNINEPAGSFIIDLAPGGPNGPNIGPSWLDIITPMSFVMIGMVRGSASGIPMLGIVTKVTESWTFMSREEPVVRTVRVTGQDMGYFFTHFGWYDLTFINGPASALGISVGNAGLGVLGTIPGQGAFLTQGPPDEIGKAWYTTVVDGDKGILSKTWVEAGANNPVLFSNAVTVQFEKYVDGVNVPFGYSFINVGETWYQKFTKIFPFPWYEFFVITAPAGFYGSALTTSWNNVVTGSTFTMPQLGTNNPAQIYVIARVNPLPTINADGSGDIVTFGDANMMAWNNLKEFDQGTPFLSTTEEFCEEEVRNFYVINPTFMRNMGGQANDQVTPYIFGVNAAVDPASIHRYGFRPIYMETDWFCDPDGQIAQTGQMTNPRQIFANLTARLAAQYEPVTLMMRAERRGLLRPDIIPGNKFTYQPLKDKITTPWTFYIDGVDHSYTFGGDSTTTLSLSRGLPSSVYGDTGLIKNLLTGNAQRLNGAYQSGLPQGPGGNETGLEGVNLLPEQVRKVLSEIAPIYATPQSDAPLNPPT